MPRRGDNFQRASYVPLLGDVVHVDWSPGVGHEMAGPHYGLVMSADLFNQSTGMVIAAPITTKGGKLSGFEVPIQVGRVSGVIVISAVRSLDYQGRDIQYEGQANPALVAEANRRLRMIFP